MWIEFVPQIIFGARSKLVICSNQKPSYRTEKRFQVSELLVNLPSPIYLFFKKNCKASIRVCRPHSYDPLKVFVTDFSTSVHLFNQYLTKNATVIHLVPYTMSTKTLFSPFMVHRRKIFVDSGATKTF